MKYVSPYRFLLTRYGFALLAVGGATLAALPLRDRFDAVNLVMFYLAAVVAVAAREGTGPSIVASIIGVSAFNFFFTQPYYSLHIYDTSYIFTFILMLLTSLIVGSLAARLREQALLARRQQEETQALYALTEQLASIRGKTAIAAAAERHLALQFTMPVHIFLPNAPESHGILWSDLREISAAKWAREHGETAGIGTNTYAGAKGLYLPLIAEHETVGALGIIPSDPMVQRQALEAHASLIASALLRAKKAEQAEQATVESETEKSRNLMLRAVSHDLRTPLSSIRGNIEAALAATLPPHVIDLLTSARQQSERLTRMLNNLLDITRLETGIALNRQPYYIDEVIGAALEIIRPQLNGRTINTDIPLDLPLIFIDGLLIEQVILNLLENAIRHTDDKGNITIRVSAKDVLDIRITDNGSGIAPGQEERIFEKFFRGDTRGTGLGLAICKGIVTSHGGNIDASRNPAGGLNVCFTLPLADAAIAQKVAEL